MAAAITDMVKLCRDRSPRRERAGFMARMTLKELPAFTGESSTQWLIFKREYENTSKIGGFSNAENMARLQQSIRGKAREAIGLRIMTDGEPDRVMRKLESRFGKPANILKTLISEIKGVPKATTEHRLDLNVLATKVDNYIVSVEAIGKPSYLEQHDVYDAIIEKLPMDMLRRWSETAKKQPSDRALLPVLAAFLEEEDEAMSPFDLSEATTSRPQREKAEQRTPTRTAPASGRPKRHTVLAAVDYIKCYKCNGGHYLKQCSEFEKLSVSDRVKWVSDQKICEQCLVRGHETRACRGRRCKQCGLRHHGLLHEDKGVSEAAITEVTTNTWSLHLSQRVLLKVAPVTLHGPRGKVNTFALLDEGSTVTLLDESVAEMIGADGPQDVLRIHGVNGMSGTDQASRRVNCTITGDGPDRHNLVNVRTVTNLDLPLHHVCEEELNLHEHLRGLPIKAVKDAKPTMLIGQDNWHLIISLQTKSGKRNAPAASKTRLGWVLHGFSTLSAGTHSVFHLRERDDELHAAVKDYFRLENLGVTTVSRRNPGEERAQQILEKTTRKLANNRWETGLLWKYDNVELPGNKNYAIKRLSAIERKMDKDPAYEKSYTEQIENLLEKGYAEKASNSNDPIWFLPHFCVTNPNKPGKLRLVFDAAAKTNGVCLNDVLLPGPDKLNSLLGVLFRFREQAVAITGDIKEMFLQVKIRKEDQLAQCFLWRGKDRSSPPQVYVMTSLIFGATSSPCTAIYVKDHNAEMYQSEAPRAVAAIKRRHYVDDFLDSVDSEEEARRLIHDVDRIHSSGGFEVRGWASNKPAVLRDLAEDRLANGAVSLSLDEAATERTLGLQWTPVEDVLTFDLSLRRLPADIVSGRRRPTKREMLAAVMSVFDPIGMLSPFTIRAKILLQEVWRSGIGWDQLLSDDAGDKWNEWLHTLKSLKTCTVPRCYRRTSQAVDSLELHVFCDASEKAYTAVAFWRYITMSGVEISFVASKSRVAPLKPMSIPRMELQAAVLDSRLAATLREEHDIRADRRVFWTDSRTVWAWIHSEPRNYQVFVAHRLGEIDDLTEVNEWRWLPTGENVADEATRDHGDIDLQPTGRWFTGPDFLRLPKDSWPAIKSHKCATLPEEARAELRNEYVNTHFVHGGEGIPHIARFSNWNRLIRSTAYVLLFLDVCRKRASEGITPALLARAEKWQTKRAQADSFAGEIAALRADGRVNAQSRLVALTPALDDDGVLRLHGRIGAVQGIEDEARRPVILDGRHPYTRLLVQNEHHRLSHSSVEVTLNELRQRYWVLRLRTTIRNIISQCTTCRRRRARPQQPRMGDLPEARLGHHLRPFTYCGLDYFGPMEVTIGRRHEKRWGALFTCLTTRAVHVELAASLNTDSAIMAIRRFAGRRGVPLELHSDNGTNFRGADNELKRALKEIDQAALQQDTATRGIAWRFIPPAAPHWGGAWERLVRSIKTALRATLHERAPREEVLQTLMAEAENIVNSRPLTHVSVDPRDPEALTPNHFLLGSSSGMPSPGKFEDQDLMLRRTWRTAQRLADHFWKRWMREYLPTLQTRQKWTSEIAPLREGELVIIADPSSPRNTWPRGKITAAHKGKDGRVRVVDVQTKGGVLRRPVGRVIALDVLKDGEAITKGSVVSDAISQ